MSKHSEPRRWLETLDQAPPHMRDLLEPQLRAADLRPQSDDAARMSRVMGRLSSQVGRPELARVFEAHAANGGTVATVATVATIPTTTGTTTGTTTAASAIKLGIAMLAVCTLAFGATLALRAGLPLRTREQLQPPAAKPVAPIEPAAPPPAAAASSLEPAAASPERDAPAPALAPPVKAAPRPTPARERAPDPRAELALLEQAQRALHDAPERALALVAEHKRHFPRGEFAQEREMLGIEALLLAGREREAQQRGRVFVRSFPGSSHMPRLMQLLRRNAQ